MKCHAGVELPSGKPCPRCGARLGEVCWPGINADLLELQTLRAASRKGDRYRHKIRGTTYRVLFEAAKAQSSIVVLEDMTMVVYQGEADGLVWVRPAREFFDGRFERLSEDSTGLDKLEK